MKTTVVCGLLGAGKTSFIKNGFSGNAGKTVVLVNDFGKAGIDGEIFSAGGIETVELPSGCICCSLKADLVDAIVLIRNKFSPDHLLIEPSGIASASGVLEALTSAGENHVCVVNVIDATEFAEFYRSGMYGAFFDDQIVHSDVILANKTDLAGEEKTRVAIRLAESINPRAMAFCTINGRLPEKEIPLPFRERAGGGEERFSHFHFETLSFKLPGNMKLDRFSDFFDHLARGRFGAVARAKALISVTEGPYRFDSVYGKVDRIPFEREIENGRLVVIGRALDEQGLHIALKGICS